MKFENSVRLVLRKALLRLDYDLHRNPVRGLTLRDLEFDLPNLVKVEKPVIVDVGANVGQTIELMCRAFGEPLIYSFEPNPDIWPILRAKYSSDNIIVEGMAFGNAEGSVEFNVSENSELSSVLKPNRGSENPFSQTGIRRNVKVPTSTLDSWVTKSKLDHIDLLKVDTQGFDLEVIRGASETLNKNVVDTLLIEVNFRKMYDGQCTFGEIEQFLKARGYGLLTLYEVVRSDVCIDWATACFKRSV